MKLSYIGTRATKDNSDKKRYDNHPSSGAYRPALMHQRRYEQSDTPLNDQQTAWNRHWSAKDSRPATGLLR